MPEHIDIHSHVNFEAYAFDRDDVIERTLNAHTWMINVGTQKDTSVSALELASKYETGVYASIGLHPVHTNTSHRDVSEFGDEKKDFVEHGEQFDYDFYKKLALDHRVVAIGECGLDYFRVEGCGAQAQKESFDAQIALACEIKKPLMLHIRNAYRDAYDMLKNYPDVRGDVHFFAGTIEEARLFLELGFSLSFTGVITFARDYDEVIRYVPLDRILCETDCPYVTPAPYRGKRNEPLYVSEIVKKMAQIRGEDLEIVKKALVSNAFKLFELKA